MNKYNRPAEYSNSKPLLKNGEFLIKLIKINCHIIWDCRTKHNILFRKIRVIFELVPGHIGIEDNDRPDTQAKKASQYAFIVLEPYFAWPKNFYKTQIDK